MRIIKNPGTDPYFNLATEEYLTDSFAGEDIFMLWRNEPAVIIGRNQNAWTELDKGFADRNGIKVVRRLTGGGAVFHDLGNLNYTFITKKKENSDIDFESFCRPVINAIRGLGAEAELSGRNDILAGGKKISGNAQCVRGGCVLHHGTLLWSADFSSMAGVLKPDPLKLEGKGIKSVRSRVGNLRDMIPGGRIPEKYREGDGTGALDFENYLLSCFDGNITGFTPEEISEIQKLADTKYSTWEWNFGAAGSFGSTVKTRFDYGTVEVSYTAEKGRIENIKINGDFFGTRPVSELEALIGAARPRLEREDLIAAAADIGAFISGACPEDFAGMLTQ